MVVLLAWLVFGALVIGTARRERGVRGMFVGLLVAAALLLAGVVMMELLGVR